MPEAPPTHHKPYGKQVNPGTRGPLTETEWDAYMVETVKQQLVEAQLELSKWELIVAKIKELLK